MRHLHHSHCPLVFVRSHQMTHQVTTSPTKAKLAKPEPAKPELTKAELIEKLKLEAEHAAPITYDGHTLFTGMKNLITNGWRGKLRTYSKDKVQRHEDAAKEALQELAEESQAANWIQECFLGDIIRTRKEEIEKDELRRQREKQKLDNEQYARVHDERSKKRSRQIKRDLEKDHTEWQRNMRRRFPNAKSGLLDKELKLDCVLGEELDLELYLDE